MRDTASSSACTRIIGDADLPFEADPDLRLGIRIPGSTLADVERYTLFATLEATRGSTPKTAAILDLSVRTIQYRLQQYGPRRNGNRVRLTRSECRETSPSPSSSAT